MHPQTRQVLIHLDLVGPLTQGKALSLYGIARLGARVHELRRCGCPIEARLIRVKRKHGGYARVAEYRM